MNTLHLNYVLEVARTKSISQAAENLFMAQPNLSKAIKELESTLKFTIFERSSKGVIPTQEGAAFLEYAENVVSEIERMKQISDSINIKKLKICIPQSFTFGEAVSNFINQNRDNSINIDICEKSPLETIELIIRNNYKLGIIRVAGRDRANFENYCMEHSLKFSNIWNFKAKIIVAENNILANKQICTNEMLQSMTCLQSNYEELPFSLNGRNNKEKYQSYAINGLHIRLNIMERSSKYWMWDSPITTEYRKKIKISQLSAEEAPEYSDYFIYKENYTMTAAEKLFLDCVYSVKNTIEFIG